MRTLKSSPRLFANCLDGRNCNHPPKLSASPLMNFTTFIHTVLFKDARIEMNFTITFKNIHHFHIESNIFVQPHQLQNVSKRVVTKGINCPNCQICHLKNCPSQICCTKILSNSCAYICAVCYSKKLSNNVLHHSSESCGRALGKKNVYVKGPFFFLPNVKS